VIENLYHITFPVSDIKKTIAFYENILGLKKRGEWPNYAEFDVGGVHFGFEQKGKLEIFLLVDDVDKAYESLKKKGVEFVRAQGHALGRPSSHFYRPRWKQVHT